MKLLVDPESLEKYIVYSKDSFCMCKIESFKPLIFKEVFYYGKTYDPREKPRIYEEMEKFALEEFKKLNGYWE